MLGQFGTFYPLTQSMELLHGAALTLLALALCILLQGRDREGLLQCQHDLIHLRVGKKHPSSHDNSAVISSVLTVLLFKTLLE